MSAGQNPGSPDPAAKSPDPSVGAADPAWAWARPERPTRWVETRPLEYHQLLRGAPRYRWWKPLLVGVLGVVYYFTLSTAWTMPFMPYLIESGMLDLTDLSAMSALLLDTQKPISMLLSLGSVALILPAVLLAMLSVGLRPMGRVWSVALRIRWRWIGRTLLPAVATLVVMNVVGIGIGWAVTGGSGEELFAPSEIDMSAALWSGLIVLLLVPIQSTAEEVAYRGALVQSLGAWFGGARGASAFARFVRGPWLPIAVSALAFAFSHFYDVWGWISVAGMGVVAAWLSWRTGGIEAAISLHVVNNLVAFGFMVFGLGGTAQASDGGNLGSAIAAMIGFAFYGWWVDRDFRRRDGVRMRVDLVEERDPAAASPISADPSAAQPSAAGPSTAQPSAAETQEPQEPRP